MIRLFASLVLLTPSIALFGGTSTPSASAEFRWPVPTSENRPWTRWWWLGSAVDKTNLTRLLTEYQAAGLGGVEICPIYGAKGYEDRFIDFLSPKWMEMLAHTTAEAKRLDLGVDMTTGTGWPFGGPNVGPEIASSKLTLKRYEVEGGKQLEPDLPQGQLQCLIAISDKDSQVDLTEKVAGRHLNWTAPAAGHWRLYALIRSGPAQKVKRAAPGGEGNVLDPYSVSGLNQYLARFDQAFKDYHGEMPRSQFHDSFEYYGAQCTPDFLKEFQARRGYDLRSQLPALFDEGPQDTVARVKSDYRETISDLHLAYIQRWTEWSHAHGSLSRNQAHGSPGSLVDIYAAADIPETEIFGAPEESHIAMNKFSSSAAHIAGHKLASSESFTWLTEHFQASLSEVKQAADYLFLSGVNHILFHGIPYSPSDAPWPGWQFYAAVNFGPQGGLWHDLPEFNAYVTHCQSILQSGSPDNDVLVYYPIYDSWNSTGDLIRPNPVPKSFTNTVMYFWDHGYAFDYVSDRFLAKAECKSGKIELGGNDYSIIVVPQCQVMPETTFAKLLELARGGATVLFENQLPSDVPGLGKLKERRQSLQDTIANLRLDDRHTGISEAAIGKGKFLLSTNLQDLLAQSPARREPCADSGLRFVRRKSADGLNYFLANRSEHPFDGWVTLSTPLTSAVILDPRAASRTGTATIASPEGRAPASPHSTSSFYLQLPPGESCIVHKQNGLRSRLALRKKVRLSPRTHRSLGRQVRRRRPRTSSQPYPVPARILDRCRRRRSETFRRHGSVHSRIRNALGRFRRLAPRPRQSLRQRPCPHQRNPGGRLLVRSFPGQHRPPSPSRQKHGRSRSNQSCS